MLAGFGHRPDRGGERQQRAEEIRIDAPRTQTDGDPGSCGPTLIRNAASPIQVVVS